MNVIAIFAVAALVHAKDYSWNATNATAALQQAIDSGAETVVVDAMPSPWYVDPLKLRSHQTIRLAKGAKIHAYLPNWEKNKKHSLFCLQEGLTDVTLEGEDMKSCLIGSFESTAQRKQYCKPGMELQTGVYIGKGATNIVVRKLSLAHCGCDGMGVGGWRIPSHNVLVEDVDMFDNHRQACSPMVADGLTFRRCHFRDTDGTEPGAGADMEPCYDVHPVKGVVFEDCEFGNNNGGGLITPLSSIFPIDVTVRRCTFHGEKGRSPISILARGDTYRNRKTPADVVFNFEDCVIESYWNDPAINIATAPIFTLHFKNCTIKEVPGWSWWRGGRVCSAIEFYLDRDYKGAFPPEKCGKITFENFKIEGFKGRPAIEFVDILGKQDVIGCMSGIIDFNGEKIDTSTINYKAMDVNEPLPVRLPVTAFNPPSSNPQTSNPPPSNHQTSNLQTSNLRLVPWGDWYEPRPCYNFYYWAEKGKKAVFSIAYPYKTDVTDFTKALKGVRQTLETPQGAVDLGELHPGTNRFEVVAKATGWHAFFPPKQNGEGNNVRVLIDPSTPLAYQADSAETGDLKFEVRDTKKDYTGYFEVPPKVECRVRVSGGTVEIFDEKGNSVGKAEEGKYPGRKIITFTSSSDKNEVYSFKTPAKGGTRRMRFYAPLTSIFADSPELLPRQKQAAPSAANVRFPRPNVIPEPVSLGYEASVLCRLDERATVRVACDDPVAEAWVAEKLRTLLKVSPRVVRTSCSETNAVRGAYRLLAEANGVFTLAARDLEGVRNAFYTLRMCLMSERGVAETKAWIAPALNVVDAPAHAFRAMHVCWMPETKLATIERQIRLAAYFKFNYLILEFWGTYDSAAFPWFGWREHKVPTAELKRLVALGRDLGVTLVPDLNCYGHATMARRSGGKHAALDLDARRQALFEPREGWVWCLTNPETQKMLRTLISEMYETFGRPGYFHIGCDESDPPSCPVCAATDWAQTVARHLKGIRDHLATLGARTLMWHDMLVSRQDSRWQDEAFKRYPINGASQADCERLLALLPKDVVVCDWYYDGHLADYPTWDYFKSRGFDVVPSAWQNAAGTKSMGEAALKKGTFGFMGTTWHHAYNADLFCCYLGAAEAAWGSSGRVRMETCDFATRWRQVGWDMNVKTKAECGYSEDEIPRHTATPH